MTASAEASVQPKSASQVHGLRGDAGVRQLLTGQVLSLAGSQPHPDREEVPAKQARLPTG